MPMPSPAGIAPLSLALVNNMPDAALRTTERQFRALLADAAGAQPIELRVYSAPELHRSPDARQYVAECHDDIAELWDGEVDGAIVTGSEPRADRLTDDPCWPIVARLADWALDRTASTIWSCFAAHAAAHYLDGVERRPLGGKLSGVFRCRGATQHALLDRLPPQWLVPHSRFNTFDEVALTARGYRVLSDSPQAGADMVVRPGKSLFVFHQGHLEYAADTLLREYRRDIRRYLDGESDDYPEMPEGYFDAGGADALHAFRERASRWRAPELLENFPEQAARGSLTGPWHAAAVRFYRNWLRHLAARRDETGIRRTGNRRPGALAEAVIHP